MASDMICILKKISEIVPIDAGTFYSKVAKKDDPSEEISKLSQRVVNIQ
jgi:hypothetical protein